MIGHLSCNDIIRENGANYKIVDNKSLRNWFKFEWENKCKSRRSKETCNAETWTRRAEIHKKFRPS